MENAFGEVCFLGKSCWATFRLVITLLTVHVLNVHHVYPSLIFFLKSVRNSYYQYLENF